MENDPPVPNIAKRPYLEIPGLDREPSNQAGGESTRPDPSRRSAAAETTGQKQKLRKNIMVSLSLTKIRHEVSAFIQGATPYRIQFARSGGLLLNGIKSGSMLERAGLQNGDLLLTFDGVNMTDRDSMMNAYVGLTPSRTLTIKIFRNGVHRTLKIMLTP